MDVFVYQEMLHKVRPDVLVECGTCKGGSAYFVASMMDLLGRGRVITIDIERYPNLPVHPPIRYLLGSSTSEEIVRRPSREHVLNELRLYHPLVTPGSYLLVEDTEYERPSDPAEVGTGAVGGCKRIPGGERRFRAGSAS